LSIVQGPFSVAPCQTFKSRFATCSSLYQAAAAAALERAAAAAAQREAAAAAAAEGAARAAVAAAGKPCSHQLVRGERGYVS
jgi:hypothetical protein